MSRVIIVFIFIVIIFPCSLVEGSRVNTSTLLDSEYLDAPIIVPIIRSLLGNLYAQIRPKCLNS